MTEQDVVGVIESDPGALRVLRATADLGLPDWWIGAGFVRNRVSSVETRRVYYLTDTEPGSSGSPVFNGMGQMIALHRAGGTPQKFTGLPPVKKNEGVRIDVIAPAILGH